MTKSKRVEYLDIAKGIGILLVIIGHIPYVGEMTRAYIVSFHMPLFLVISGMLIWYKQEEEENLSVFVKKKFRSILVPYAVFSVAFLAIECGRIIIKGTGDWGQLFRLLYQSICLQGVSVLWFFPALFIGETVFLWIRKHSSHWLVMVYLPVMMATIFVVTARVQVFFFARTDSLLFCLLYDIISMLLRGLFCAGFIGIGYYLCMFLMHRHMNVMADAGISIILLIVLAFISKHNANVDLRYMFLGKFVLFMLGSVLGSVGVILLCRVLVKLPIRPLHRMLGYFGVNSMLIMVTHLDFRALNISIKIATFVNGAINNNVIFCIIIVLFVCVMEVFIIEFVNRVLRKLVRRVKNS